MYEHIVKSIICSEYERSFDGKGEGRNLVDFAMKVTFSLNSNYDVEDGYRHLDIFVYGGGSNYIGVYARADWNVIRNEWSDGDHLLKGYNYIKGQTPWVLYGYHDSCWRDAVETVLREFRERICTIDYLFSNCGWYTKAPVNEELREELYLVRKSTPGYGGSGERVKLTDLDFQFPAIEVEKYGKI